MNLLRFDSEKSWTDGMLAFWKEHLISNPNLRMCVPSGKSPTLIFSRMGEAAKQGTVSFGKATIFALDEYGGLEQSDPGRCKKMLEHDLISKIDLRPEAFHALNPDVDAGKECARYEKEIGEGFDLVILGLGVNGHLGLNEPGSANDSPTRRTDLHPTTIQGSARYLSHQNLPTWGLTVGMKRILNAKEVWLIANGSRKAEIVREVVTGSISEKIPASLLRKHPRFYFFLDEAAAGLL